MKNTKYDHLRCGQFVHCRYSDLGSDCLPIDRLSASFFIMFGGIKSIVRFDLKCCIHEHYIGIFSIMSAQTWAQHTWHNNCPMEQVDILSAFGSLDRLHWFSTNEIPSMIGFFSWFETKLRLELETGVFDTVKEFNYFQVKSWVLLPFKVQLIKLLNETFE